MEIKGGGDQRDRSDGNKYDVNVNMCFLNKMKINK